MASLLVSDIVRDHEYDDGCTRRQKRQLQEALWSARKEVGWGSAAAHIIGYEEALGAYK
jgi:hypothetical protein